MRPVRGKCENDFRVFPERATGGAFGTGELPAATKFDILPARPRPTPGNRRGGTLQTH